jgi:hypothetical protein
MKEGDIIFYEGDWGKYLFEFLSLEGGTIRPVKGSIIQYRTGILRTPKEPFEGFSVFKCSIADGRMYDLYLRSKTV